MSELLAEVEYPDKHQARTSEHAFPGSATSKLHGSQVMEMYLAMAATAFYVAALGMWIVFASHALWAESRVAAERRSRKELDLKCKVRSACQTLLRSVCKDGHDNSHVAWSASMWL